MRYRLRLSLPCERDAKTESIFVHNLAGVCYFGAGECQAAVDLNRGPLFRITCGSIDLTTYAVVSTVEPPASQTRKRVPVSIVHLYKHNTHVSSL